MTHWHYMMLEHLPKDSLIQPMLGEEPDLTREQAHQQVQTLLDGYAAEEPAVGEIAEVWRQGAKDHTVYYGPFIFMIFECDGRCTTAYLAAVEPIVDTMRRAGVEVALADLPNG